MVSTLALRYRILALLTGGGLAAACGGTVVEQSDPGAGGTGGTAGGTGGSAGRGGVGGTVGTGGTTGGTGGYGVGGHGVGGYATGGYGAGGYGTGGYGTGGYGVGGYATGGYGAGGYGTGGYGTGGYGTGGYGTGGYYAVGGVGGTGGVSCGCAGPGFESCYTEGDALNMLRPGEPAPPPGVCPSYTALAHPYQCSYFTGGPWRQADLCCYWLVDSGGCIGRPFIVDGELRRADITPRNDWSARLTASENESLDAATRRALADSWLDDAALEHASIASFARLTLELLALGAPPDLVALSQAASLDEIEHARRCFALASRYAETPLGPGALCVEGATRTATSLVELAVATIREGCIGETLASLIAAAEFEVACDRDVRWTLELISEDEARHAELAWRIVSWALDVGGPRVRQAIADAFRQLLADEDDAKIRSLQADVVAWHAHGRLTPTELAAVRRRALREVIRPCAEALLRRNTPRPELREAS